MKTVNTTNRRKTGQGTAWQEVLKLDPKNQKAQKALAGVEKVKQPIADAFGKYQMAIVKKDFSSWKGFVNKDCMGAIEDNIRKSLKAGVKDIKNVREFFDKAVAQDPANEKSAMGATLIAFEEIKPGLVQVYYT
jgi:cytochrome c-type biogenesis protein CcmH/NrfG